MDHFCYCCVRHWYWMSAWFKGFSKRPGISQRLFFSTLWPLKVLVFIWLLPKIVANRYPLDDALTATSSKERWCGRGNNTTLYLTYWKLPCDKVSVILRQWSKHFQGKICFTVLPCVINSIPQQHFVSWKISKFNINDVIILGHAWKARKSWNTWS